VTDQGSGGLPSVEGHVPIEATEVVSNEGELAQILDFFTQQGYSMPHLSMPAGRQMLMRRLAAIAPGDTCDKRVVNVAEIGLAAAGHPEPTDLLAMSVYQLLELRVVDVANADEYAAPRERRLLALVDGLAWVATGEHWLSRRNAEPLLYEEHVAPAELGRLLRVHTRELLQSKKGAMGLRVAITCLADLAIAMAEVYPIDPYTAYYPVERFIYDVLGWEAPSPVREAGDPQELGRTASGVIIDDQAIDDVLARMLQEPDKKKRWWRRGRETP
jgi:hypothetical protein